MGLEEVLGEDLLVSIVIVVLKVESALTELNDLMALNDLLGVRANLRIRVLQLNRKNPNCTEAFPKNDPFKTVLSTSIKRFFS